MKFLGQVNLLIICLSISLNSSAFTQNENAILKLLSDTSDYSSYCKKYKHIHYDTILSHIHVIERNNEENSAEIVLQIASAYIKSYDIAYHPGSMLHLLTQTAELLQKNQSAKNTNIFITIFGQHILTQAHLHIQNKIYNNKTYSENTAVKKSIALLQENDYMVDIPMTDFEKLRFYWNKKEYAYIKKRGINYVMAGQNYFITFFMLLIIVVLILIKHKKRK